MESSRVHRETRKFLRSRVRNPVPSSPLALSSFPLFHHRGPHFQPQTVELIPSISLFLKTFLFNPTPPHPHSMLRHWTMFNSLFLSLFLFLLHTLSLSLALAFSPALPPPTQILPPLRDVKTRPEVGDALRNKLVRLMTHIDTDVKRCAAELLFVLCKENVSRFVKYTGYGNAAGLLAARGLLGGGRGEGSYSEDEDSDTEEYKEAKHK
uniref:Synembryn n=1 Tax=Callorhinchus milii TaxID=7868 RepID=A0A4W3GDW9_CALMI